MADGRLFSVLRVAAVVGIVCTGLFLLMGCFNLLETFGQINRIHADTDQHPQPRHRPDDRLLRQLNARVAIGSVGLIVGFTEITFGWIGIVSLMTPYLWSYIILQICNMCIWCVMFGFLDKHSVPIILLVAGCANLLVTVILIVMVKKRSGYDRLVVNTQLPPS